MLTLESRVTVPGLTGAEITTFLSECTDAGYQQWWPGVHLHLHSLTAGGGAHLGDEIFMDEFIGTRRLRMTAVVVEAEPGRKIMWQMKKGIRLPAWLTIEVVDHPEVSTSATPSPPAGREQDACSTRSCGSTFHRHSPQRWTSMFTPNFR